MISSLHSGFKKTLQRTDERSLYTESGVWGKLRRRGVNPSRRATVHPSPGEVSLICHCYSFYCLIPLKQELINCHLEPFLKHVIPTLFNIVSRGKNGKRFHVSSVKSKTAN